MKSRVNVCPYSGSRGSITVTVSFDPPGSVSIAVFDRSSDDIYRARQEDCASCPLRLKCLSKPHMLRKYLVIPPESQPATLVDEMKAKIDSPQGRLNYARRLAIVEPVFANIRIQKRLDRFTLRTKSKVDVQWMLFALVHNIGKIHKYGRGN
jgi:hypothetical protein